MKELASAVMTECYPMEEPVSVSAAMMEGDPMEELTVRTAVLAERVARIEQAIELQAIEYKRRMAELNHEAARVAKTQSVSVTAEKFEDYKATSQRALALALETAEEKFTARVDTNLHTIAALTTRVTTLESDVRADRRAMETRMSRRQRSVGYIMAWAIAGLSVGASILVVIMNLIVSGTP